MDGIERDLEGQAQVIRLSVLSDLGSQAARRYGVRGVPTFLIFDGDGRLVDRSAGFPDRESVVTQVNSLLR